MYHNDNYDDELGLNLESEDCSKPMSNKMLGRGKLKINDAHFIDNVGNCYEEVEHLKEKFRNMMVVLMGSLKKYTKKGVYSYLDEAFTRLNFNSFYIDRDAEGLD